MSNNMGSCGREWAPILLVGASTSSWAGGRGLDADTLLGRGGPGYARGPDHRPQDRAFVR